MLRVVSDATIILALTLMWLAMAWVIINVVFADPAVLVFEDVAIGCAVLAPLFYLVGWGLRSVATRFGSSRAVQGDDRYPPSKPAANMNPRRIG
jgi:hypothetical protein